MSDSVREQLERSLRSDLERTINQRVERYLSVDHQPIMADHHFAHASSECLDLFRDGYFISCIMLTQAVAEGIIKFVSERNKTVQLTNENRQEFAERLRATGVLSKGFVDAYGRIQKSFRNDFHHMNPKVSTVDLEPLARRNIADLAAMEREIFGFEIGRNGTLRPKQTLYWDIGPDGNVPVYVRLT
jgi:hypothetical protein